MRYESKVDWWIPALLFGGLALATGDWIASEEDEWRDGAALRAHAHRRGDVVGQGGDGAEGEGPLGGRVAHE